MKSYFYLCSFPLLLAMSAFVLAVGIAPAKSKSKNSSKVSLPNSLLDAAGTEVSREILKGKYVGIYFSASWCPPCRTFTPKLVDFRNANKEEFEVVLVGADRSAKAQANYMKKYKMPWLAVKHQSLSANLLVKKMGVSGIPYLVILAPDGSIVTKDGRSELGRSPGKALAKWKKG